MSTKKIDVDLFEKQLENVLLPVRPSKVFVKDLRQKINFRAPVVIAERISTQPSLLLIFGGVLSVSLLILTVARGVFYLVNKAGKI